MWGENEQERILLLGATLFCSDFHQSSFFFAYSLLNHLFLRFVWQYRRKALTLPTSYPHHGRMLCKRVEKTVYDL